MKLKLSFILLAFATGSLALPPTLCHPPEAETEMGAETEAQERFLAGIAYTEEGTETLIYENPGMPEFTPPVISFTIDGVPRIYRDAEMACYDENVTSYYQLEMPDRELGKVIDCNPTHYDPACGLTEDFHAVDLINSCFAHSAQDIRYFYQGACPKSKIRFCQDEDRNKECWQLVYISPVCGFRLNKTTAEFQNECLACADPDVLVYSNDACPV